MTTAEKAAMQEARDAIKKAHEERCVEVNGRKYILTNTSHSQRLTVFAYHSSLTVPLKLLDFSFFDTPEWARVQQVIDRIFLFENEALVKLPEHWERYPQDYVNFYLSAMQVVSYPFLAGGPSA